MAALRIGNGFFELWRAGYGGSLVTVYLPGTTTKASLFTDEALTIAAANPQTLQRFTQNGITYGKLLVPIYVGVSHYLNIDALEQTGVVRLALTSVDGVDGSDLTVIATGSTQARALEARFADIVNAEDFGLIGPAQSAATNTATITAAIAGGSAVSSNGARIQLPEGTYAFTQLTVPVGVILEGRGNGVTILQSQTGDKVITITGNGAGLARLTLDGVNLVVGSIGVYAKAKKRIVMEDVLIKRFETGGFMQGMRRSDWKTLDIDGCGTGMKLYGDNNASGGADGDELRQNVWDGGVVSNCTSKGIEVKYVDKKTWNNTLRNVGFESNPGTALWLEGVRYFKAPGCYWTGNVANLVIKDGTPTTAADVNTTIDVHFDGGSMSAGAVTLQDTLQDVIFDKMELSAVAFLLTLPGNDVVLRDCIEDSSVTVAGDGTRLARARTMLGDFPGTFGLSTSATPVIAWAYKMAAGEVIHCHASVVAVGRNGIDYLSRHIGQTATRAGAALNYVTQTANFVVGDIITGATSGAKARIMADADAGATGTLTLKNITKEFLGGEVITGAAGGSATASGTLTYANSVLRGALTDIEAIIRSDAAMGAVFQVTADEMQILVTGAAAKTMEWTVSTRVTSSG